MPGFLRQATAAQARALGPFVDETDFKTAETGLTIANTDIKLVVNGGASANKNSGGGTHRVNGVYGVTFDATDSATVGEVEVSVVVAGALPVFDKFFVIEEAVFDALFAASAPGYGTAQTGDSFARLGAPAGASVSADVAAAKAQLVTINADTDDIQSRLPAALDANGFMKADVEDWKGTTAQAMTGDAFARLGAPAGASVSADIAAAKAQIVTINADTDDIQTRLPAALVSGRIDASVGAMAANVLTATAINADAITDAKVAADVTIASVTGAVGSVTGAVGSIGAAGISASSFAAGAIDAAAIAADAIGASELAAGAATEIATAVSALACTEPAAAPAANPTLIQAISWQHTLSRNKITQTATDQVLKADDGSTTIASAPVSDDGVTAVRGEFV